MRHLQVYLFSQVNQRKTELQRGIEPEGTSGRRVVPLKMSGAKSPPVVLQMASFGLILYWVQHPQYGFQSPQGRRSPCSCFSMQNASL